MAGDVDVTQHMYSDTTKIESKQPSHAPSQHRQHPSLETSTASASVSKPATHRLDARGSVQALVVDDDVLIAGLQGGQIVAWSLKTYVLLTSIEAHEESVLGLHLSSDGSLLFSCGVDSVVNVWSPQTFERLYSLYSHFEIGDIFCLAYDVTSQIIFCGCQNAGIQWLPLPNDDNPASPISSKSLANRKHRFFDSLGPGGASSTPSRSASRSAGPSQKCRSLYFPRSNYLPFAHKSYIYSMIIVKGLLSHATEEEVLITGGGDGVIKIWRVNDLSSEGLMLLKKFKNPNKSVLSLAYSGLFLYAGMSSGTVHVYNLASGQLVQKLQVPYGDINSVRILNGITLCGTSHGWVKKFDPTFADVGKWSANSGKILASVVVHSRSRDMYITGGNDRTIAFWDISDCTKAGRRSSVHGNDDLITSLKEFVSYRTIAANDKSVGDCHEAVAFLRKLFNLFEASTTLLPVFDGANPILLAKFGASKDSRSKKTVLFYGHYDVVDAEANNYSDFEDWVADPFQLNPLNGYLYGRGVTDNKGPILAALYAVADLVRDRTLACNVVFLLEGEEEAGSRGFEQTVKRNRAVVGEADYILLSNSYWLDDHIPCLTYGMRGVIHATVSISSGKPDRHSGMDGKARQHEPLKDLTVLLSALTGPSGTQIMIPGFYDDINDNDKAEFKQYLAIAHALAPGHPEIKDQKAFAESLMQRWREPNLTIHRVEVPESKTAVTISRFATAALSIRIVPNQDAAQVAEDLASFLKAQFARLKSANQIAVSVTTKADPWLGEPSNQIFQTLENAITHVWNPEPGTDSNRSYPRLADTSNQSPGAAGDPHKRPAHRRASSLASKGTFSLDNIPRKPLYIREGGSIPVISFLEREFRAPAAMFPMGQSSDNAHLSNERMRVENLYKGREVLRRVFGGL